MMKAVRATASSGGKVQLALESVARPEPNAREVLVQIKASAVQPSDILNAKGLFPHTTWPRTPGRDFSGVVVDGPPHLLNKEVFGTSGNSFSFTADGAHAEYAVLPLDGVCIKPPALSWRSSLKPGETILVLGGNGSVGSWVSWIAKAQGGHVITVGRHGTDVNSTTDPKLESVAKMTTGKGVDVVVDTVGDLSLTSTAIDTMSVGGRLVTITAPRMGSTEMSFDVFSFYRKELSLLGCNTVEYSQAHMTTLLNGKLLPLFDGAIDGMPNMEATEVGLDLALEAYQGNISKAVIVFNA